ncbi:serine/threonine-protein kinase [Nocardioides sp. GY 10113]|uniref:serine/threonine-protein kinase n=1 Tax=Nocardioides sp. GY 10113 TaxID=2569761 RepID=UPI00145882DB|nr:serine/threonine-protein kinase [Nocardioides sp. GY 10113]
MSLPPAPGSPAPGYPVPGSRVGRFRVVEELGRGGTGVVFRAVEDRVGREVALKVIDPLYARDPEFRARFAREAQAQESLESTHVVAVHAHGEEDGHLYIASQLVATGDLGARVRASGVLPQRTALEIVEQVADGLADIHGAGLVHRDLKPGNVLVGVRGGQVRAYLCDVGIARRLEPAASRFSAAAGGTPTYMAPELHRGAPASAATDIYSLGCLLWMALTGEPPYGGAASEYELISSHRRARVPQLRAEGPREEVVNRVLRTAMAKEPGDRYPSAAAMRDDVQAALRLPPAGSGADPVLVRAAAVREGRSSLRWWLLAVLAVLGVIAAAVGASALSVG